jgi:ubiquinone/menaquinone biosynthesis C-methylase UbiE
MEDRKRQEAELHDFLRSKEFAGGNAAQREYYTSNKKFYSVTRASTAHTSRWLKQRVRGQKVLDCGCGDGTTSFRLAEYGAKEVVGIDISEVSVENCRREAARCRVDDRCSFLQMDAENMIFPDSTFDLIVVMGVLHHLDVRKAFPELARVLKPRGKVMCLEALGHNPVFQWYRNHTPHLRTAWETEHIIRRGELELAMEYFGEVETRFFHLASLLAVPFRKIPVFTPLLTGMEAVDSVLMRLPGVKWQAWMIWFVLSSPIKHS